MLSTAAHVEGERRNESNLDRNGAKSWNDNSKVEEKADIRFVISYHTHELEEWEFVRTVGFFVFEHFKELAEMHVEGFPVFIVDLWKNPQQGEVS